MTNLRNAPLGELVFWAVFLLWSILGAFRVGFRPESYSRPGRLPIAAFWNAFDRGKWTDEGIAYHRRLFRYVALTAGIFLVGRILVAVLSR